MTNHHNNRLENIKTITIGYARVSSTDNRQELGLSVQKEALGFWDKLYIEKDSGGNQERKQLDKALTIAKKYAAEWELQAISERTKDGLRKAKEKGVKLGNKGLPKDTEKQIIEQYLRKELSVRNIANQLNISTATIYNVLRRNSIQINRKNHL